jgi:hypothetical protein
MFWWLTAAPGAFSFLVVTAVIASLTAMTAAASIVVIPELLPTAFRSIGISLVYAIGTTLFGGTTQFVVTGLLAWTHNPNSPAWYLAGTSVISLVAIWLLPETHGTDISA